MPIGEWSSSANPSLLTSVLHHANELIAHQVPGVDVTPLETDDPAQSPIESPQGCYSLGNAVAAHLANWKASASLVAAALLHPFVRRDLLNIQAIEMACGQRVAFLCQEYQRIFDENPARERPGTEYVRRRIQFYVAAYQDPDLVFLAVANLWERYEQAKRTDATARGEFVHEARDVTIPLLDMLGMRELWEELSDWVFQNGKEGRDYRLLRRRLADTRPLGDRVFEAVQQKLALPLPQATVAPHSQCLADIYDPRFPERAHPEAFQTFPIDVIVPDEEACYAALHAIHRFWRPLEGKVVDYVGASKLNGYRALHTTVYMAVGDTPVQVEFRIRTPDMEEVNRWGLAAVHLRSRLDIPLLNAWWTNRERGYRRITVAPPGALPENFYVFSPHGELFKLPQGATVVDYAYRVHSEVANQCQSFWLNGVQVEPTTTLRHLDLIWVEQDPQAPGPTRVWLSAARTARARSHIERFLRRQTRGSEHGRMILRRRLKFLEDHYGFGIPDYHVEQALQAMVRRRNFGRIGNLMAEIAAGRIDVDKVLHPLFSKEIIRQVLLPEELNLRPHQIDLAQCCRPRPGDDIVGKLRRKHGRLVGLKVHCRDCERRLMPVDAEFVELGWRLLPLERVVMRLDVSAMDKSRLLGDALEIIYAQAPDVILHRCDAVARHGVARLRFTIETDSIERAEMIADEMRQLPNHKLDEVRLIGLSLAERDELAIPHSTASVNPYNRLPVRDRDMFFGRRQELDKIRDWLSAGQEVIYVRGQKRIGKTSLLLYLKEHLLEPSRYAPIFVDFQLFGRMGSSSLFLDIANAVYSELQSDTRIAAIGAPLRTLFEANPPAQLANYLKNVQRSLGKRLVLLLDEFSTVIEAHQQGRLDAGFFTQWRGLMTATRGFASYVHVVQQQVYKILSQQTAQDPGWQIFQLGEILDLPLLQDEDARDLIERPIRNYFQYSPEVLERVHRLTGGSPFLINAFCRRLVEHMKGVQRQRAEAADIEAVSERFMHPAENLFAHLLELLDGPMTDVAGQLAKLTVPNGEAVSLAQLQQALPGIKETHLRRILQELEKENIVTEVQPKRWQFTSLLFANWLVRYPTW